MNTYFQHYIYMCEKMSDYSNYISSKIKTLIDCIYFYLYANSCWNWEVDGNKSVLKGICDKW